MVTVTVSDVNDEYPQFEEAGYEVTLEESAPSNTLVYDVDAFDNDEDGVCEGMRTALVHKFYNIFLFRLLILT